MSAPEDDGLGPFRAVFWGIVFDLIIIIVVAVAVWAAMRRGAGP